MGITIQDVPSSTSAADLIRTINDRLRRIGDAITTVASTATAAAAPVPPTPTDDSVTINDVPVTY